MTRPLLISDCDEVLFNLMPHFSEWLRESRGYEFEIAQPDYADAVIDPRTGRAVPQEEIWPLIDSFFDTEMHRQNIVPGAA